MNALLIGRKIALNEQWNPRYMPLDETCYIIGVVVGSVRPE